MYFMYFIYLFAHKSKTIAGPLLPTFADEVMFLRVFYRDNSKILWKIFDQKFPKGWYV